MNVYDEAHNLEKAIKESEEYKQFKVARDKVATNEELDAMLKDFQQKQMEVQAKQMMGEEIGDDMDAAVADEEYNEKGRRNRTSLRNMREFLDYLSEYSGAESCFLAVGDGISLSTVK